MKSILFLLLCFTIHLKAQNLEVIASDSFDASRPKHYDISVLQPWGNPSSIQSAFRYSVISDSSSTSFPSITLTDTALNYNSYTSLSGMRTTSAIDYVFPTINRLTDTLTLEFDALWPVLTTTGEAGRIVPILLYDHPGTNIPLNAIDNISNYHPYGRPAYSFRVLNKLENTRRSYLYMFYGGGKDRLGEVEQYNGAAGNWWLPGFVAQPTGTSPGTGPEYPDGPSKYYFSNSLASNKEWRHYTWKVFPERLILYVRKSVGGIDQLKARMTIPRIIGTDTLSAISKINAGHNSAIRRLPDLYHWFPTANAIRLYFRAGENCALANVQIYRNGPERSTTSTTDLLEKRLTVFPNPTVDYLQTLLPIETIQLFSLQGVRYIINRQIDGLFYVGNLPTGLYTSTAQTAQGVLKGKVLIQR